MFNKVIMFIGGLSLMIAPRSAAEPLCGGLNDTLVPSTYNRSAVLGKFQHIEPHLQIFTHRRIECDGYLAEWQFVARHKLVYALHLAVFRKQPDATKMSSVYSLVNSTFIQLSAVREYKGRPTWVSYKLAEPFKVQKGDVLGIFYDKFDLPPKLLTIIASSRSPFSDDDYETGNKQEILQNTYLIPIGHKKLLLDSVREDHPAVDVMAPNVLFEEREPALTAVIISERSMASAELLLRTRFNANSSSNSKAPAPPAETYPFRVLGSAFPNDDLETNETLEQTNNYYSCSSGSALVSAFRGMKVIFGDHKYYPSLEAGLHIFEELRVPCSGELIEWSFLAPSTEHHFLYGLNLAVFRPLDKEANVFRVVNETRIGVARITGAFAGKWVAYTLPVEKRMPVQEGDYLGFFYNQFRTMSQFLTIATSNEDAGHSYRTWVFEYDRKILEANNRSVNVKESLKTHRRPALAAKVGVSMQGRRRRTTTIGSVPTTITSSTTSTTTETATTTTVATSTLEPGRVPVWLNVIGSGKTTCSAFRTNTSIYEFENAESCKFYVGDNKRECKVEAAADGSGFGICIASKSECEQIGAIEVKLYRAATLCYSSINRNYRSCLHENLEQQMDYCSPVAAKAKSCFSKHAECQEFIQETSDDYDE